MNPHKLIEPIIEQIYIKSRVVVFCDEGLEDWEKYFKNEFDYSGINFDNLIVLDDAQAFKESFSIFMFDWGGMSIGNDLLRSFIRHLYRMAEENPSKDFVLLSTFTKRAYEDMDKDRNPDLHNIYSSTSWIDKILKEHKK